MKTNELPALGTLLGLLSCWQRDPPLRDNGELRVICHQPNKGAHAYLHRLYPGLSEIEIADVEAIVGENMPPRLGEFYRATNGARLFGGQVSVSGLVTDFSRDPSRSVPISIEQDNRAFALVRPEWRGRGYFRVGGVSFMRQDELICGPDDHIVILSNETGEPLRDYPDVFACLETFTREMAQFWTDEGAFTGDWQILDRLLLGANGTA